jgi:peroxiredoxin
VIGPLYNEWKSRGLEVLAVAINTDAQQKIPDFAQRFGASYPIAIGNSPMVKSFADISAVKNFFVPYMFLIDRRGVIRYEHEGQDAVFYQNEAVNLRAELDKLLKEPTTTHKSAPKTARKTS